MSTKENNIKSIFRNIKPNDKHALIGALIIFLIVIGIGITGYYFGKNEGTKQKLSGPTPIIDLSAQKKRVLGASTFNFSGKISKKEKEKIIFSAKIKDTNNNIITKDITALINDNTVINKWDLSKPPATDQISNSTKEISYKQLKSGQDIIVKSSNDINGKNEITASTISLLQKPFIK